MNQPRDLRLAIIATLAQRLRGSMGRTALMKLVYFLQILKEVPLSYSFRLYTYGPFEPQVLEDLSVAETMGGVRSDAFSYPGGYGYAIGPGDSADRLIDRAREQLSLYEDAIHWAVEEFGSMSAIDLETASTIIYVDRAAVADNKPMSLAEIVSRVAEIKPRLKQTRIEEEAQSLNDKGLLAAAR